MLKIGDRAPDFELTDADGRTVTLAETLESGPVVIAFYPADFTPVCTAQNCMMRDRTGALEQAGYTVLAISPQSHDSHRRFADRHGLTQRLLADPDRTAIRAFGVGGPLGITRRATFVVGADGVITDRAAADLTLGSHRKLLDGLARDRDAGSAQL